MKVTIPFIQQNLNKTEMWNARSVNKLVGQRNKEEIV
jgi:hypothetical protein